MPFTTSVDEAWWRLLSFAYITIRLRAVARRYRACVRTVPCPGNAEYGRGAAIPANWRSAPYPA